MEGGHLCIAHIYTLAASGNFIQYLKLITEESTKQFVSPETNTTFVIKTWPTHNEQDKILDKPKTQEDARFVITRLSALLKTNQINGIDICLRLLYSGDLPTLMKHSAYLKRPKFIMSAVTLQASN